MADRKANTKRAPGGRPREGGHMAKADSRRTHGGQGLEARPKDTWRTYGGQAPGTRPEHIAASLVLRENPTVNCLVKKEFLSSWFFERISDQMYSLGLFILFVPSQQSPKALKNLKKD